MNATNQRFSQLTTHLQRYAALAWHSLRSPTLTVGLVIILLVVFLLGLLIPQQTTPSADADAWISRLPPLVQLWGEPLFFLGFARIFRSIWFWGPAALLLLNSLIALADYVPGSWLRLGRQFPLLAWQHPLANRAEYVVRLPKSPDAFLEELRSSLSERGFFLYEAGDSEERTVGVARRRWAWFGVLAIYTGLVLLVGAGLISHAFLETGSLSLTPLEPRSNSLFSGEFELATVEAGSGPNRVNYLSKASEDVQTLNWRLYQPAIFDKTLILPLALNPILIVEVRNRSDSLLKLIPVQQDLPPSERLTLPLDDSGSPLYFLIPSTNLAVQIVPEPDQSSQYNIQVRRGSEASPSENRMVSVGQSFEIGELSFTLSLGHGLTVWTHRDPALPLYVLSLVLIIVGSIFTIWLPPVQIWLVPEVKGLGGQLYGVVETLGSTKGTIKFLEQLLVDEDEQEQTREDSAQDAND